MAELSSEARNNLEAKQFVFPKERRYPISDLAHAKNALARSSGKSEEGAVKAAVFKKFPTLKEHSKHDKPKDDCAHCMHDAEGKPTAEDDSNANAASKAAEHDEKHGKHEDCPNCAARKDGRCDAHADDSLTLNGPIAVAPVSGENGEKAEAMKAAHAGHSDTPDADCPWCAPHDGFKADDTLTPSGPIGTKAELAGGAEPGLMGSLSSLSSPAQPPAPDKEGMLSNPDDIQEGSTENAWNPQGESKPHPMTGKQVRMIKRGGQGGSLGEDGGRITHGTLGKVVSVDNESTALVSWEGHGEARTSLINLEEAKERADGVTRFDVGELLKPEYMTNGWVKVDGFIARSGFLEYRTDSGKPWIEYRPPDEAFKADSLDSFALVPLTNTHPPEGLLDSTNTSRYQTGSVDTPRQDGDKVRARILVTDADAVAAMRRGRVELSCGYTCDVDNTPGTVDGKRYDAIQRNVRGNHVALVDVGRAGSEVRVRMDGLGMVQSTTEDNILTTKIKIDGVDYDTSEPAAQAFRKTVTNYTAALEKAKARADGLEAENKKLKAEIATAPEKVRAEIENRTAIERDARKILGAEAKFDGQTDLEIRRKAAEAHRGVTLEGRSDAYVEAAFDQAVENADGVSNEPGLLAPREPVSGKLETSDNTDSSLKFLTASMDASKPKTRK